MERAAADACEERYEASVVVFKAMTVEFLAAKSEGNPAYKEWVVAHGAHFKDLKAKGMALRTEMLDLREAAAEADRLQAARDAESREAAIDAEGDSFEAGMAAMLASLEEMPAAVNTVEECATSSTVTETVTTFESDEC